MEEKKSIKVSLGTLIFVVIIVLLIAALVGMYYFYNFVTPNNNKNNNSSNISNNTVVNNMVIENTEKEETVNSVANEEKTDSAEASSGNKDYITFKDVVGNYYAVDDSNTSSDEPIKYSLYLTDAGTYFYEQAIVTEAGIVGNYIIDGNKIILNKLFYTNNSAEVTAASGTIELTFNQDGTITDSKGISEKTVVLKKDPTKETGFDVKSYINRKIQESERYTL